MELGYGRFPVHRACYHGSVKPEVCFHILADVFRVFAKLGGFLFENGWSHKNSHIKLGGIWLNAAFFCAILLDKRNYSKKGGFRSPLSIT